MGTILKGREKSNTRMLTLSTAEAGRLLLLRFSSALFIALFRLPLHSIYRSRGCATSPLTSPTWRQAIFLRLQRHRHLNLLTIHSTVKTVGFLVSATCKQDILFRIVENCSRMYNGVNYNQGKISFLSCLEKQYIRYITCCIWYYDYLKAYLSKRSVQFHFQVWVVCVMEDFLKTLRDPKFASKISETIKSLAPDRRVKFVHICGTV